MYWQAGPVASLSTSRCLHGRLRRDHAVITSSVGPRTPGAPVDAGRHAGALAPEGAAPGLLAIRMSQRHGAKELPAIGDGQDIGEPLRTLEGPEHARPQACVDRREEDGHDSERGVPV